MKNIVLELTELEAKLLGTTLKGYVDLTDESMKLEDDEGFRVEWEADRELLEGITNLCLGE